MQILNNITRVLLSNKFRDTIIWTVVFLLLFSWVLWGGVAAALMIAGLSVIVMIGVQFITLRMLIPFFLIRQNKIFLYLISTVLLIILLTVLCVSAEHWILRAFNVPLKGELRLIYPVSKYSGLLILTFTICNISSFSKKMEADAEQQVKLQTEKKMLELKVLKTQINSHFLFNALNNIYSMIYFKDQDTAVHVLKLSQMMRYVIEDCEAELTTIGKEVDYIDNFIEFQQLRFETEKDIIFTKNISNYTLKIPPMILQPMVENCFKHCSLDLDESSYIHMHLEAGDKQLIFSTENTYSLSNSDVKERSSRIGLANIRRRLELIFKDRYVLDVKNSKDCFRVVLQINFE